MRDSVSHDSWTNDELQWMSACAVYADALPPSSPIAIPSKRGSYERPAIGINDSLTLLRTKGLPRRHTGNYQKPTKASRAKVTPPSRLDTFQATPNARYRVTPPAPRVPPSPLASSAPACPVSPLRSKIPRLSRAPDSTPGASFPSESHTTTHLPPSPGTKNTEWLYRRPKLTSTSSSCSSSHFQSRLDTIGSPRTRSPLPSCPAGSCPERKHERASGPSNESNTSLKYPPSPPTSYSWSIQHRRYRSEEPQTPSQEVLWEDFDYTPPSPRHMSRPERPKLILQRPSRSTSVSTASSSSSSSRPHTPTLQQYSSQSSSPDDILHLNPESYPRSILTRTSSTSTTKYSPSIMVSHNGRKRSGSGSKSVKFVEIPTVHYASIDSEWDIPDEEECMDLDTESDMEDGEGEHENDEEMKPFPPHHDLGSLLGFQGETKLNLDVDGCQPKDKRLLKSFSLKQDHASPTAASLRRKTEKHSSSVKVAPSRFISGPFALGTLPKPPPPAPPFVMPHAAKGTSVSLRSAPSFESFKSVKSTGGRSILSVKSLRSLPGSLKSSAQGLKDWFKGRRVTVD